MTDRSDHRALVVVDASEPVEPRAPFAYDNNHGATSDTRSGTTLGDRSDARDERGARALGARGGSAAHHGRSGRASAPHTLGEPGASSDLARIADALERIAGHLDGAQQARPRRQAREERREDVEVTALDLAAADAVATRFGVRFKRRGRR
jgi:hypothetical protein